MLFGAAHAAVGVAAGAFGAHGLRERVSTTELDVFKTGASYELVHGVALVAIGAAGLLLKSKSLFVGGTCIAIGAAVFAITLYALALTGVKWLGAITPIGGAAMILGWILVAIGVWRQT